MDLGKVLRWLSVGLRIGAILEVLKGVDARAPSTTSEAYAAAAPVALASTSAEFMSRLTPEEQANIESTMRVALFWLDWKTQ
jgi:hypothetical protein